MNLTLTILLFLLLFLVIAQPQSISLHPLHIEFKNLGYGLGIILIILGAIAIHIESRKKAIDDCVFSIKQSFMKSLELNEEQVDSLWNGDATLQELKPEMFEQTQDGDKCNHKN